MRRHKLLQWTCKQKKKVRPERCRSGEVKVKLLLCCSKGHLVLDNGLRSTLPTKELCTYVMLQHTDSHSLVASTGLCAHDFTPHMQSSNQQAMFKNVRVEEQCV